MLLFITDPWETLDHPRDTTLRIVEELILLGEECHWCDVRSVRFEDGRVLLPSRRILSVGKDRTATSIVLDPVEERTPHDFDRIFYRTDPPVDLAYLHPLQMLALQTGPEISPPLEVLLGRNEKLEAAWLGKLMPATIASAGVEALEAWGIREKTAVLKPLHQAQSKGVERLDFSNPDELRQARARLKAATENGRAPVLLQRFLPGISKGETRLWFLNGKLLACARKLPARGEFRIDMDRGGTLARHTLTRQEKEAASRIGKHLRRLGVRMAAVDLIDGFVTDFNFTSPGLIVGMEKVLGRNLAREIARSLSRTWR